MPWVPIDESGVEYDLNSASPNVVIWDSVVVSDGEAAAGFSWSIALAVPARIGVIVLYSEPKEVNPEVVVLGGISADSASLVDFVLEGDSVAMPTTDINPENVIGTDSPASILEFQPCSDGEESVLSRYNIVVYVWQGEEAVSYNCECDDPNPGQTLAQLRTRLMRRLGFSAMTAAPPPGMAELLNDFLQSAQEYLYRTYRVLRTERFYTWSMVQGVRFYDLDANEDVCTKKLDPRMITWVGISNDSEWWQPLVCGIPPEFYSWNQVEGWPERYEIRQCIEVWPAPDASNWKLRIKGHFGLEAFDQDDDQTTIDSEAVFLHALARAKAHYGQPDAANYQTDAMNYIRNLTAGAHMTRRYVPGAAEEPNPIPPRWLPLGNQPP